MQFTGLQDKNDKKIYEGDILKDERGQIAICEFSKSYDALFSGFLFRPIFNIKTGSRPLFGEIEIIGNIYENENLLYGKK